MVFPSVGSKPPILLLLADGSSKIPSLLFPIPLVEFESVPMKQLMMKSLLDPISMPFMFLVSVTAWRGPVPPIWTSLAPEISIPSPFVKFVIVSPRTLLLSAPVKNMSPGPGAGFAGSGSRVMVWFGFPAGVVAPSMVTCWLMVGREFFCTRTFSAPLPISKRIMTGPAALSAWRMAARNEFCTGAWLLPLSAVCVTMMICGAGAARRTRTSRLSSDRVVRRTCLGRGDWTSLPNRRSNQDFHMRIMVHLLENVIIQAPTFSAAQALELCGSEDRLRRSGTSASQPLKRSPSIFCLYTANGATGESFEHFSRLRSADVFQQLDRAQQP